MLINLNDDMSDDEKIKVLLAYHQIPDSFVYDNEDIAMLILALNQDDIERVSVDDEGVMDILYYGDGWQQHTYKEEQ